MTDTIRDLMNQLDSFAKEASATEGIDSMPGSEHDKDIPAGATEPDPKVKDDTIDNEEHKSTAGAEPGSDFPANNANELQADEPALTADKKPLDTADANAKEAAARRANDIVSTILKSKQAAAAKTAKPSEKKAAPDGTITLDMAMLAKIAAITLADDEGQVAIQNALSKHAGAEFANEVLDVLEKRAAEEQAAYEFEKGAQDAEAMIGDLQEAQGAADAEAALGDIEEAQGEADAEAALGDAEEAAGAADAEADIAALDDYSTDEIVEAVQELADEGEIPPEQAEEIVSSITEAGGEEGAPDDVSEEDVAEALTEAVESGELAPEEAQAIVQAIAEGEGDPEADQALAAEVADAGAGEGDVEKEAAVKRASFKQQLVNVLKGKK